MFVQQRMCTLVCMLTAASISESGASAASPESYLRSFVEELRTHAAKDHLSGLLKRAAANGDGGETFACV